MVNLIGYAACKLDEKNRLTLPSRFLKQLEGEDTAMFVLKPNSDKPCIDLYPQSQWEDISTKLKTLDRFQPEVQEFLIHFLRGHQPVTIDKAKRIAIPPQLKTEFSIGKEVVLVTILDMIQIWDAEEYQNYTNKKPKNFYDITKQALRNKND